MICLLAKAQYKKARPLFQRLEATQPMCTAVLEGVYPGKIFVDHPDQPQTAFLSTFLTSEDEGVWGFLAGHPANVAFNRALNRAIFTREIVGPKTPIVFLTCDPQDWGGMLPAISEPSHLMAMPRRRYVCRELHYDWRVHVPLGFTIQPMSTDLLRRPDLEMPDDVRLTIEKWRSATDPRFQDFGFAAIHEVSGKASIAGWATIDFVVNGTGDIGFFTLEAYRRRGLASVAAAAALEHGLTHGLSWINWTCAEDNLGSIRTARRLGLQREQDYAMYYFLLDEQS